MPNNDHASLSTTKIVTVSLCIIFVFFLGYNHVHVHSYSDFRQVCNLIPCLDCNFIN